MPLWSNQAVWVQSFSEAGKNSHCRVQKTPIPVVTVRVHDPCSTLLQAILCSLYGEQSPKASTKHRHAGHTLGPLALCSLVWQVQRVDVPQGSWTSWLQPLQ